MVRPAPRFVPRRALGRTGFEATRLGIGDLADRQLSLETCVATLRRALDAGLNVVDTAPSYEQGYSEEIVGAALRGRGDSVFLIDKIDHLDRPVGPQIDDSLRRLGLRSVDLFAFHDVSTPDAWARLLAAGGAWDELGECVRQGKARFRGLSSHHPEVLRSALQGGGCDVVLFPVGPFCDRRYLEEILPMARARGAGTVCFKAFGAGKLLGDTEGYGRPLPPAAGSALPRLPVEECVRYTLTADPDVALLGMSSPAEQDEAWAAAERFRPLSPREMDEVRSRAADAVRGKGGVWWNPAAS